MPDQEKNNTHTQKNPQKTTEKSFTGDIKRLAY